MHLTEKYKRLSAIASNIIGKQQSENGNKTNMVARYGGRYMKAQDGVVFGSLQPKNPMGDFTQAYDYFMHQAPEGPYSTTQGRLYSGVQSLPSDQGGRGVPFDRQMGYVDAQGNQTMYPQYNTPEQLSAMYGTSAQSPQVPQVPQVPIQGQGNTPIDGGMGPDPNYGSNPGYGGGADLGYDGSFTGANPTPYQEQSPNYTQNQLDSMDAYGFNPYGQGQGQGQVTASPPSPYQGAVNQGVSGVTNYPTGSSYYGPNQEEYGANMYQEEQPYIDESFGVLMSDQNPAPVMGPENMPEGYGDTAAADEFLANNPDLSYQGVGQDQGQVTQDPLNQVNNNNNDPNNPGFMSRLGDGLGKIAPYASSMYNIGMGIAGLINPPKGLKAGDYMAEQVQGPKALDAQAMLAPQMQMASTYMSQTADPRRKQMFASKMAPQTANMYAKVNQINDRNRLLTDRTNAQIGLRNKQMQLKVDDYNRRLAAQPYEFLKQGVGQLANTYMAQQNYNLMGDLANTANYQYGQYMPR